MLNKNGKLYYRIVRFYSKLTENETKSSKSFWNHPAGPKTIFFWAPMSKWLVFIAGFQDYTRPPQDISIPQTVSLVVSSLVMGRFALTIEPLNYNLFVCNLCLGIVNSTQLWRVYWHKKMQK